MMELQRDRNSETDMLNQQITISDDSGFLALVDPDAYQSFVDEDWSFSQLLDHFKAEMSAHHLLIWATGREDVWRLQITTTAWSCGYRAVTGSIVTMKGRLLLTNYDDLTLAAQFREVLLPQLHQTGQVCTISPGAYSCRIVQTVAPGQTMSLSTRVEPDFVIELRPIVRPEGIWLTIPWFEVSDAG
jgi:hypothetical protein